MALCHYNLRQYAAALKYITEIIERGIKDHPGQINQRALLSLILYLSCLNVVELSVGMQTEGVDIRSVGNTAVSEPHSVIADAHSVSFGAGLHDVLVVML